MGPRLRGDDAKRRTDYPETVSYGIGMNSAVSLGSFPRRREPITRDLTDTEYGSPPARGRRKPRADHPETVAQTAARSRAPDPPDAHHASPRSCLSSARNSGAMS